MVGLGRVQYKYRTICIRQTVRQNKVFPYCEMNVCIMCSLDFLSILYHVNVNINLISLTPILTKTHAKKISFS